MFVLLKDALCDIAARRGAVARLMLLPLLANLLAELNLVRAEVASGYMGGSGASLLSMLVNMAVVGVVAVGWHRIVLLGERASVVPARRGVIYWHYVFSWFVLGLVIVSGLLLAAGAVYVAALLLGAGGFAAEEIYFYLFEMLGSSTGGMFLFVVPVVLFSWLLFRFGVLLPHLALGRSYMSMRRAWRLTQPQAWPIAGAALGAGVLQSIGFVLMFALFPIDFETGEISDTGQYLSAAFNVFLYTFSGLIGAAILTAIYKRIDPAALAQV